MFTKYPLENVTEIANIIKGMFLTQFVFIILFVGIGEVDVTG